MKSLVTSNEADNVVHGYAKGQPRVALVSGFWGQNIGNAFFNLGGKWVLEQVFGSHEVQFIQDQPGYRTFNNQLKGNPRNDAGLLRFLDVDYLVLQGPVLTAAYPALWADTLRELEQRGTRLILLGAAFFKYNEREFKVARDALTICKPALISTRDQRTYEILKSWGLPIPLYNGLDSAFFVPRAHAPFRLATNPYYAFNFDRYPEPTISVGDEDPRADYCISVEGRTWNLYLPAVVSSLAARSKAHAYLGHLIDRRKLPTELNGHSIIRPEHRFNPHMTYKIYQHRNALASDEPWTYFTVYSNAQMTLADRVHACVLTLAYGKPAMLFTPSPRSALFERVGCGEIRRRPVSLDPSYLEEEQQKELEWLRAHV